MSIPSLLPMLRSIVFVDARLPQLSLLLDGLPRDVEVVLIDSRRGGLEQMADVLAGREGIESIHLICHGVPGALYCGNHLIDVRTLEMMQDQLHVIANAMVDDGEWLLYGCEVAQGGLGRCFVDELALATGLRIGAASYKVGAAEMGGNWVLDYAPQAANHTLQIPQWPNLLTGTTRVSEFQSTGEFANLSTFVAVLVDGSVVSWGPGSDISSVAGKLDGTIPIRQVFSNSYAFAAVRVDGSVVTWGNAGGDSSAVASKLDGATDVTQIYSSGLAFAAVRADGSVVTWGDARHGGDSSTVASKLDGAIDVTQIFSNYGGGFAALRADGSVVTWGNAAAGGDSSAVASKLDGTTDVTQIFSTLYAFAAVRADGSVVTWGTPGWGGTLTPEAARAVDGTIDVVRLFGTYSNFAALRADGSVIVLLENVRGPIGIDAPDPTDVANKINGTVAVTQVASTTYSFAALRTDGSVVTWGDPTYGGDSSAVASALDGSIDVTQIYSNEGTFAALRADGSVVTGGYPNGGDSSAVASALDGNIDVTEIYSGSSFAALRADGSVVTWGFPSRGGDSSAVASKLINVVDIANVYTDVDLSFVYGSTGNDTLSGGAGKDILNGGAGLDTALFSGSRDLYTLTKTSYGMTAASTIDGTDTLINIERLQFSDKTLAFDLDGNAGQAYRLYQAAFDRVPDQGGLGYWIREMDQGVKLSQVATGFINSAEFRGLYGNNPSSSEFVTLLYDNVLHRAPDAGGYAYWMEQLAGGMTREDVLIGFSESTENKVALMAFSMDGNMGKDYRLYQAAFDRKPDVSGLDYWYHQMNSGMVLTDVAAGFINSAEFKALNGSNPSNGQFVTLLYDNVLHRAPDAGGYTYWTDQLAGGMSKEQVLIGFSESHENQLSLVGIVQNGIDFV